MKTFWIRTASAIVYAALFIGSLLAGFFLKNPNVGLFIFGAFLLFVAIGCTFEFFRMVSIQGSSFGKRVSSLSAMPPIPWFPCSILLFRSV